MKTKVRLIIMNHLSDICEQLDPAMVWTKLNFAKYLLMTYPNTDTEVYADEVWRDFETKHSNLIAE